jgi:hypothetical protein
MENSIFSLYTGKPILKSTLSIILFFILSLASPKQSHAQSAAVAAGSAKQIKAIIEKHLNLWNERDKNKRKKILNDIYAPDIEMVDRHFVARGRDQIDAFIADLQKKSPDFRFSHAKPVDTHHNIARMYWQVGNAAHPAAVTGMDFFVVENGKVKKLYVFVEGDK